MTTETWSEVRLGDLIEVKHGFAFDGKYFRDSPTPTLLLTPGNFAIGGGFQIKDGKEKYYDGPIDPEYVLKTGDLLVTMTDLSKEADTLGYPAFVPDIAGLTFLHNQRLGKVVLRPAAKGEKRFLYYLLSSAEYRSEILAGATGTTVKHTAPVRIESYHFSLPPKIIRRAMASLLGALDDRIDLNRQMNRTLEQLASALFKSWFVDFDPVQAKRDGCKPLGMPEAAASFFPEHFEDSKLGPIPRGWRVGSVYEVCEVCYGAPFASGLFNTQGFGLPLIRIRDLDDHAPRLFTTEDHPKATLVDAGDIVVGMDGEFRAHIWRGPRSLLNQRVCKFVPRSSVPPSFLYSTILEPLAAEERSKVGTTVSHLNKADIDRFQTIIPPGPVLEAFGLQTEHPVRLRLVNEAASRSLVQLRNALLPAFLSGEITIKHAEKAVAEVV